MSLQPQDEGALRGVVKACTVVALFTSSLDHNLKGIFAALTGLTFVKDEVPMCPPCVLSTHIPCSCPFHLEVTTPSTVLNHTYPAQHFVWQNH